MKIKKLLYVVVALLLFTVSSIADDITLDFEGLKNMEQVQNFYNGGTGSEGSTKGFDYNITFSANTLALIDSDAGGSGNFANEPSPNTIFFFTGNDKSIYMNVEGGFTEGFSFYYTSIREEGDVEVWTDYNGTGKKIGSLHLDKTPSLGKGDPTGAYDNWVKKSLSFDGRAKSIVFKGVANQIGFDNISLNPNALKNIGNISFSTAKNKSKIQNCKNAIEPGYIKHGTSYVSDEFQLSLSITSKSEDDIKDFCSNYNTYIVTEVPIHQGEKVARQIYCKTTLLTNQSTKNKKVGKLILNYKLSNRTYFELGKLILCDKHWYGDKNCHDVGIKNFSVYGSLFDLRKDAFIFRNGSWNKAETKYYKDGNIYKNKIAKAGDVIQSYLSPKKYDDFWDSVGWSKKNVDVYKNWFWHQEKVLHKDSNTSHGLCYGMAMSAISNFNHKKEKNFWNIGVNANDFKKSIENHWNKNSQAVNPPYKPFNKQTSSFKRNEIDAIKKIMYYFVAQEDYKQYTSNQWVGSYEERKAKTIEDYMYHAIYHLPAPYLYKYIGSDNKEYGHATVATQIIKYNKTIKIITYDNNYGNITYVTFVFDNNKTNNIYYYTNDKLEDPETHKKVTSDYIGGTFKSLHYVSNDPLQINAFGSVRKRIVKKRIVKKNNTEKVEKMLSYSFPNHIKIYMVGGTFKKITLKENNKDVVLYPLVEMPKKGKAYKEESNIFSNTLLLPADKQYKISVKKSAGFPFLKLFVTIPKKDGTAEYLVYNHAEVSEKNATFATLTVGRDNNDTALKREDAPDYTPDEKETYKLALLPVSSLNAIVLKNEVKVMWKNPDDPNYSETVVIRKKDSKPTSITDGTEVYRGTDEVFEDTNIKNDVKYYYAIYTISNDGDTSEGRWVKVDTYRYSLYGTVLNENNNPIPGAKVTLYNNKKTHIIDTTFTSEKGMFSFNGLLDGEYILTFEHPFYKFKNNEFNVTVEKKSKEVSVRAEGVANLFMEIPQAVKVGESQSIIWDGVHIDESATINIKLFRNNKWETIASNVLYSKHLYKWNVTAPKGEAKLRIELDDKTFVEKDIFIFGTDEVKYDFDGDGDVDVDDIMKVANAWTAHSGDAKFKSEYDFNGDGVIDIKDIMKIASKWGM